MADDYITRVRRIINQMLDERDEDGAPVWTRPFPNDRSEGANRFHDELCYRLRLQSGNETQRMLLE